MGGDRDTHPLQLDSHAVPSPLYQVLPRAPRAKDRSRHQGLPYKAVSRKTGSAAWILLELATAPVMGRPQGQ